MMQIFLVTTQIECEEKRTFSELYLYISRQYNERDCSVESEQENLCIIKQRNTTDLNLGGSFAGGSCNNPSPLLVDIVRFDPLRITIDLTAFITHLIGG